jgi:hypothetical protein
MSSRSRTAYDLNQIKSKIVCLDDPHYNTHLRNATEFGALVSLLAKLLVNIKLLCRRAQNKCAARDAFVL